MTQEKIMLPNNHPFGVNAKNNSNLILRILKSAISSDDGQLPQNLILSCSGGVDSTSLVLAVSLIRSFHSNISAYQKIKDVYLVHFHHGLRTDGSAEADLSFCQHLAEKHQFHFIPVHLDPNQIQDSSSGTQAAAHDMRRNYLTELSSGMNNAPVLTAHHLDDQVEHLIYRLLSGREISPIPMKNGPYIRPFLGIEKRWLQEFCLYHNQNWREDPSNQSLDYDRNKIRNGLLPVIYQLFPTLNIKKAVLRLGNP